TVGVAGLIQSGGFGSFSKRYGLVAAGALETQIVTADGARGIGQTLTKAEPFLGLKGGGGGRRGGGSRAKAQNTRTPSHLGRGCGKIRAASDTAFRALIARATSFYHESLFNRHWGEQMAFGPENTLRIAMVFQGLDQQQAEDIWQPFLTWLAAAPQDFSVEN